jgi:hypothetical protein
MLCTGHLPRNALQRHLQLSRSSSSSNGLLRHVLFSWAQQYRQRVVKLIYSRLGHRKQRCAWRPSRNSTTIAGRSGVRVCSKRPVVICDRIGLCHGLHPKQLAQSQSLPAIENFNCHSIITSRPPPPSALLPHS